MNEKQAKKLRRNLRNEMKNHSSLLDDEVVYTYKLRKEVPHKDTKTKKFKLRKVYQRLLDPRCFRGMYKLAKKNMKRLKNS